MPAPNTAYLNNGNTLPVVEEDNLGNVINQWDALVAAYIYGAADIKALFYIDSIVEAEITDDAGTLIQKGFIGCVNINGPNFKYHNPARFHKTQFDVENLAGGVLETHQVMNDGALNTKGNVESLVVTINVNGINAVANFKSAFYQGSPKTAFTTTSFLGANRTGGFVTVPPNGGTASVTRRLKYTYQQGDTFAITASIESDEGTFVSDSQNILVTRSDCFVITVDIVTASGANVPSGSILFGATNGGVSGPAFHPSPRIEWAANGTGTVRILIYIENSAANGGNISGNVDVQITGAFMQGLWFISGNNLGDTYTFFKNTTAFIRLTNH